MTHALDWIPGNKTHTLWVVRTAMTRYHIINNHPSHWLYKPQCTSVGLPSGWSGRTGQGHTKRERLEQIFNMLDALTVT